MARDDGGGGGGGGRIAAALAAIASGDRLVDILRIAISVPDRLADSRPADSACVTRQACGGSPGGAQTSLQRIAHLSCCWC